MPIVPSINDVKRSRRLEEGNARIPRDMRKLAGSIIIIPVIDNRSVLEKSIEFSINSFSSLIIPLENALADIPELSAKESFASSFSVHEFAGGGTYASLRGPVAAKYKYYDNTSWWGYSLRDTLNFSGTTRTSNNITLITPQHGVYNTHFGGNPVGFIATFNDHTTNAAITGKIESKINLNSDCTLVKFEDSIAGKGDITVCKLPLFLSAIPAYSFPMVTQGGSAPFGNYNDRYAGLCTNNTLTTQTVIRPESYFISGNAYVDVEVRYQDFQLVDPIFADIKFGLPQAGLAVGDSGSPAFIIYGNDILLYTTYLGSGGSGCPYGLSGFQERLKYGIETLGSEGYTISTVRLS
mgnify:CR=1 FL=1